MALSRKQIAQRAIRGLLYQGLGQYGSMAIGLAKGMLLARLVAPEYFGQVALALTYASFLNIFKFQLREGITRDTSNDAARLFTVYVVELVTALPGFLLTGLLLILNPLLAQIAPALAPDPAALWLALAILGVRFVSALASVPTYLLERDLRHDVLARLTLLANVLSLAISVPVAAAGRPVLAVLLDQAVILPVVTALGAALAARWRPRPVWDRAALREHVRLGSTLWTNGIFSIISFAFDDYLVGTFRGDEELGYYSKAYTPLAKLPLDVAGGVIASVALGVYGQSRAAGQAALARAYSLMTWLLARIIALSSVVLLAATEEITLILYGPDWLPVVPLVRLMALYVIGRPFWQNDAQLLISIGQEKRVRSLQGVQALILVLIGPPLVLWWGAAGASIAVSAMMVAGALAAGRYTLRQLEVRAAPLYLLPVALGVLLTPALWWLGAQVTLSAIPGLLVKGALAAAAFAGAVLIAERRQVAEMLALLSDNLLSRQEV